MKKIIKLATKKGFSLAEMITAFGISTIVLFSTASLMLNSSRTSDRTQVQSKVDNDVAIAVEKIQKLLLEAKDFEIENNGTKITFHYPQKINGNYQPNTTDATTHSITLSGSDLIYSGTPDKPILSGIPETDPDTNSTPEIFSHGTHSKEIVIKLFANETTASNKNVYSKVITRVRPRNY
ncbi:MAG: hypothetical protein SNJ70_07055 [Armatimonadota bacterium]